MAEIYANNAKGELAEDIAADDTSIQLASGHTMPSLDTDEWFRATLYRWEYADEGVREYDHEVVKVTDIDGDTLTVERELEGEAHDFEEGTPIEVRWTAGAVEAINATISDAESGAKSYTDDHADKTETHGVPSGERLLHTGDRGTSENQMPRNSDLGSAAYVDVHKLLGMAYVGWDFNSDSYYGDYGPTAAHTNMRRCVLNSDGEVQYYLDKDDSSLKANGEDAVLDGSDGQVMVEIPKFWYKTVHTESATEWYVSDAPMPGYSVHPAFKIGDSEIDHIYVGAYQASVYSDESDEYIDGLNLDDNTDRVDLDNDHLGSVVDTYPMVGLRRREFRQLASNYGDGKWHLIDFWTLQAVQLLYLTEYGDHHNQSLIGRGNVDHSSYPGSSDDQSDSPHEAAGRSNGVGNGSGGVDDDDGTPWMSYRGIEDLWGNVGEWLDGCNCNDGQLFVADDPSAYEDDTDSEPYEEIGSAIPTESSWEYPSRWQDLDAAFIPEEWEGSSTSGVTDAWYVNNGWRVPSVGGLAYLGDRAGLFCWILSRDSGFRNRSRGSRVVRRAS